MAKSDLFQLPDNYIYISHIDKYYILPNYPDSISDSMSSSFQEINALSRSAPVLVYSNSGPRSVQIDLNLHRDLMDNVNTNMSNADVDVKAGEDYVDSLVRALQSIALPAYNLKNKAVQPPIVMVRLADEIFIRGVVNGGVGVTYKKPILTNGKYAQLTISFKITEIDPYDANSVYNNGGFRGITSTMKEGFKLELNSGKYEVTPRN